MDYAAATPMRREVFAAMQPYWFEKYANTGAMHTEGLTVAEDMKKFRSRVREIIGARDEKEIIFTSGGTESNSLAIKGFIDKWTEQHPGKSFDIITSEIEHPSVSAVFSYAKKRGAQVHTIATTKDGVIDLDHFSVTINEVKNPILVSVMMVNNEIGTLQPIKKIASIIKNSERDVVLHCDASQAPLYTSINVQSLGVDMLTLCGQKMYGPKASGVLYIRSGINIQQQMLGGKQEFGMRGGTTPMPLVAGFTKSLELADSGRDQYAQEMKALQDYFLDVVLKLPGIVLNGKRELVMPVAINLSFEETKLDSERLVAYFDVHGVAVSSKSACIGSDQKTSTVIDAMGFDRKNSIRFSLGKDTRKKDIDTVIELVKKLPRE